MRGDDTTVRFDAAIWELLTREAERDGLSVEQFVRDSAMLRMGVRAIRPAGIPPTPVTLSSHACERISGLARRLLAAPISYVWLDDDAPPRAEAVTPPAGIRLRTLSRRVTQTGLPVVVHDTHEEILLGHGDPRREGVVAYVGAPLAFSSGAVIGALCVVDQRTRLWTTEEVDSLTTLAAGLVSELELQLMRG